MGVENIVVAIYVFSTDDTQITRWTNAAAGTIAEMPCYPLITVVSIYYISISIELQYADSPNSPKLPKRKIRSSGVIKKFLMPIV